MNILIVKLSSLGDVVQTLPVLHDIHAHLPQAGIDWAVEEGFQDLVRRADGVRRVLPFAQRRWRKTWWEPATRAEKSAATADLRREVYDVVLDCQGLVKSALVARAARLARGGFRATFGNRSELCSWEWPVRYMVQRPVPMPGRVHAVARTRLLAARALGYDTPAFAEQPPVYPWKAREPAEPQRILLAHGTSRTDNEWPLERWSELASQLVDEGLAIVLPQASDHEREVAERIAAVVGAAATVLPRMPLAWLLDELAVCAGAIGVDSGVSHMAVALDLPVVEIFSQPRAWRAGPVGRAHQRSVGGDAAPDVATVWSAWRECWSAAPRRRVAAAA